MSQLCLCGKEWAFVSIWNSCGETSDAARFLLFSKHSDNGNTNCDSETFSQAQIQLSNWDNGAFYRTWSLSRHQICSLGQSTSWASGSSSPFRRNLNENLDAFQKTVSALYWFYFGVISRVRLSSHRNRSLLLLSGGNKLISALDSGKVRLELRDWSRNRESATHIVSPLVMVPEKVAQDEPLIRSVSTYGSLWD